MTIISQSNDEQKDLCVRLCVKGGERERERLSICNDWLMFLWQMMADTSARQITHKNGALPLCVVAGCRQD